MKLKKIVTIGGGKGQSLMLSGLRDLKYIEIASIVSMFDSGGSTGVLRKKYGILPPGDIIKCVLALSPEREKFEEIFKYRFKLGKKLKGHSLGNLTILALNQISGNFPEVIDAFSEVLGVQTKVMPVTTDSADIMAILEDGKKVFGEANIDIPNGKRAPIKEIKIISKKKVKVYPPAVKAIQAADYLIFAFGDFYTSLIPNLLVPGIKKSCQNFKGKIIYTVNICTKKGETDNYTGKEFVLKLEKYLGRKIDYAIFNSAKPKFRTNDQLVEPVKENNWDCRVIIKANLLDKSAKTIKHDPRKLARVIDRLINKKI
jgi:uncharacterized cofD-like protein